MYMRPNMAFAGFTTIGKNRMPVFRDRFDATYRVALDLDNKIEYLQRNDLWIYESGSSKRTGYAIAA